MVWWYEDIKYGPTWPDDFFKIFDLYPSNINNLCKKSKTNTTNVFWKEDDDKDIFEFYIPGYSKEYVGISVKDREIEIFYSKNTEDDNRYSFHISEEYELPTEATVKDGVLTIEFYKKKQEELKEYNLQIN